MSRQALEEVIGRAATDPEFARQLIDSPAEAVAGYDLTEDEIESLKTMQFEAADPDRTALERRTVKTEDESTEEEDDDFYFPSVTD